MCLIQNKYINLEILFSLIYLKKFKAVTVNTASHTTAEMGVFLVQWRGKQRMVSG